MNKKIKKALILTLFSILMTNIYSTGIKVVTEKLMPYSYKDNSGNVSGFSTQIVKKLMEETGIKGSISVHSWSNAFDIALTEKNVLIYSIGRNTEREKLFKWVGVITDYKIFFYGLKSRKDIKINSLDDAKKFYIGTVSRDFREQFLIEKGFIKNQNLYSIHEDTLNIKKLIAGRISLWPVNDLTVSYIAKENKIDISRLENKYTLLEIELYLAFSTKTSDEIVRKFSDALKKIKSDGTYQKIKNNYLFNT